MKLYGTLFLTFVLALLLHPALVSAEENGVKGVLVNAKGELVMKTFNVDGRIVRQYYNSGGGSWKDWDSDDGGYGNGDYFGRGGIQWQPSSWTDTAEGDYLGNADHVHALPDVDWDYSTMTFNNDGTNTSCTLQSSCGLYDGEFHMIGDPSENHFGFELFYSQTSVSVAGFYDIVVRPAPESSGSGSIPNIDHQENLIDIYNDDFGPTGCLWTYLMTLHNVYGFEYDFTYGP